MGVGMLAVCLACSPRGGNNLGCETTPGFRLSREFETSSNYDLHPRRKSRYDRLYIHRRSLSLNVLILLRTDSKTRFWIMIPLACFIAAMQWLDLSFNIMPALHPDGFQFHWLDAACFALIGGVLAVCFLRWLYRHPMYPIRDPRLKEFLTIVEVPPPAIAEAMHQDRPLS